MVDITIHMMWIISIIDIETELEAEFVIVSTGKYIVADAPN